MKTIKPLIILALITLFSCNQEAVKSNNQTNLELSNPFTTKFLTESLRKDLPRLVLNDEIDQILRNKLKTDAVVKNIYQAR